MFFLQPMLPTLHTLSVRIQQSMRQQMNYSILLNLPRKNPYNEAQKQMVWRGRGVPIWLIMKIDFKVFSDKRELYQPAAFTASKNIDRILSYRWPKVRYFYCTHNFKRICRKSLFFKLQNLSSPKISDQSSPIINVLGIEI